MSVLKSFFTLHGRMAPKPYLLRCLILFAIGAATNFLGYIHPYAGYAGGIISLIVLYSFVALSVKRLHDANRSGWWMIVFVVVSLALGGPLEQLSQSLFPGWESSDDIYFRMTLTMVAANVAVSLLIALTIATLFKSSEEANTYGSPTARA